MSKLRMVLLFATGIASALACGNTTTLGGDKPSGDANGGTSHVDAGLDEDSASASGGSGASASGGGGVFTLGDASFVDAPMAPCNLPELPPVENPTPEELERAQLIHDYCAAMAREGCLGYFGGKSSFISDQTVGCSIDEQIIACEQDSLYEYTQLVSPTCDDAWQTAIRCLISAEYGTPCIGESPGVFTTSPVTPIPCNAEKQALGDCLGSNSTWASVTGSRTTCDYGQGTTAPCSVSCQVGGNYFSAECGGPEGLPLRCVCTVNGTGLGEFFEGGAASLYVSDCEDAATQAANGWCVKYLDCCVQYFDGTRDVCMCGSDPAILNMSSCEALAEYVHGTVVDICPQYEFDPGTGGTCWPPPCQ